MVGLLVVKFLGGIWKTKIKSDSSTLLRPFYNFWFRLYLEERNSYIGKGAIFRGEPCFPHGITGIFISGGAEVGCNAVIFQHVTIGSNTLLGSAKRGAPIIGNNCYIGAGAKIIGNIRIGDNVRIGANCVVVSDIPNNCVVVLDKPRIIQKDLLDNRYYTKSNERWGYFDNGKYVYDSF